MKIKYNKEKSFLRVHPNIPVPEPQETPTGEPFTPFMPPAVEGFTFLGWYIDRNFTIPFVDGTIVEEDIDLYGKWSDGNENSIKFTFAYGTKHEAIDLPNSNTTGIQVLPDPQIIPIGETFTPPELNTFELYDFQGWYVDIDCNVPYVSAPATANMTLYADWTFLDTTVTINIDVGKIFVPQLQNIRLDNVTPPDPSMNPDIAQVGEPYFPQPPAVHEEDNLVFRGYFRDEACTIEFVSGTILTQDDAKNGLQLYAKWALKEKPIYGNVLYAYATGTFTSDITNKGFAVPTYNALPDSSTDKAILGIPYEPLSPAPSELWSFKGWFLDTDCTIPYEANTLTGTYPIFENSMTLFGKWELNVVDYNVYFDYSELDHPENVLPEERAITIVQGSTMNLSVFPQPIESETWEFIEWCYSPDGTDPVQNGDTVNGDITLYGVWKERTNAVQIVFNVNKPNISEEIQPDLNPDFAYEDKTYEPQPIIITDTDGTDLLPNDNFVEWTFDETGTDHFKPGVPLEEQLPRPLDDETIELFAQYETREEGEFRLTYEMATNQDENPDEDLTMSLPAGDVLPAEIPNPDTTGEDGNYTLELPSSCDMWIFDDYYADSECTEVFEAEGELEEDTVVYGNWELEPMKAEILIKNGDNEDGAPNLWDFFEELQYIEDVDGTISDPEFPTFADFNIPLTPEEVVESKVRVRIRKMKKTPKRGIGTMKNKIRKVR